MRRNPILTGPRRIVSFMGDPTDESIDEVTTPSDDPGADDRGSLWRRWDPHVHLPGTLHNDGFEDLSVGSALDILAACTPRIEVVGVTDYCTTASFRRAQAAWESGAGPSIRLLFPNVELRLSHATKRDSAVNIHLLCAAEDVDDLDRFLGSLEFTYGGSPYRCDDGGLRALGWAYKNDRSLAEGAALQEGARQFKIDFDHLRTEYERSAWAKEHLLVAVAGGTNDGTSGLQTGDNAFTALRQSIERFSHIIFSADPQQAEFWTGRGVDDEQALNRKYNGKKLCLHGSDAHCGDRLGMPDLDRRCWLKGRASFETLRMACLAPDTRGHIGANDPMDGYRHRVAR